VVMVNPSTIFGAGDVHLNTGKLFQQIARGSLRFAPPGGNSAVALDDVVEGHLLAMEHGAAGRRYILNDANLPHAELMSRVAATLGRPPVTRTLPRWSEAPLAAAARIAELAGAALTPQVVFFSYRYRYFSADRAGAELGWSPRAGLDSALPDAADWYESRGLLEGSSRGALEGSSASHPRGRRVA
jgi:dihydroflavonol-4-reductase